MKPIHIILWLPMVVIAFANAALRELVITKKFDVMEAHQLSTVTLIIFCSLYIYLIFPFLKVTSTKEALLLGGIWTILTVFFEFSLGRLTNKSWGELLLNYNLFKGHLWIIFLVFLFLMPMVNFRFRHKTV